jgi:hypothetical protein
VTNKIEFPSLILKQEKKKKVAISSVWAKMMKKN